MNRLDWLEEQLDSDSLSPELRSKYEGEANRIANRITDRQVKEKETVEAKKAYYADLRAKLLNEDLSIIDTHGIPEFGDDYETIIEGADYVVYSKVSPEWTDSRWVFSNAESADSKFRKLVWDRLYHKYVRTGEVDQLNQLYG